MDELWDEGTYDRRRLRQWQAGTATGFSRRDLLHLAAASGLGLAGAALAGSSPAAAAGSPAAAGTATAGPPAAAGPAAAAGPIVKPLPPELLTPLGTNAEMRWSSMAGQGHLVPIDRFFVRNHTSTPIIDPATWTLRLTGAGLEHGPTDYSYADLRRLPAATLTSAVECAGNGRSFFASQQGQTVSGTAWKLGAIGVARWRGVRLSTLLRHAGLTRDVVDLMPAGLDANFVSGGVDLGPVRRPLPLAKALKDVLIAYEMNGEPLPPDHGAPARLIVPGWVGISSIKWLGSIDVATEPLFSPWNTQFYRLFGAAYPVEGQPFDRQVIKSAFELDHGATLPAGRTTRLRGRSWSADGAIARIDVSTDGGTTWRRASKIGGSEGAAWQRWELPWRPAAGTHELLARATDVRGNTQPDATVHNELGYLFDAVVRHRVVAA